MTAEEAIQTLKIIEDEIGTYEIKTPTCYVKRWPVTTVKAFDMVTEALEYRIPKKPEIHTETIYDNDEVCDIINCFTCPVCDNSVAWFHKYCDNCGQAMDWSEVGE